MRNTLFVAAVVTAMSFAIPAAFAVDECKTDADCKAGTICVLVLNPHICKPPQEKGAACVRDAGCASGSCDIAAGQQKGVCK